MRKNILFRLVLIRMFTNFGRDVVFTADLCYNGSSKKAFLREEGGTRSVTEGACVTLALCYNFIVTRSPSVAYGASSLPEGALVYAQLQGYGLCPMPL